MRILLTFLLLTACGTVERHEAKDVEPSAQLADLYALRLQEYIDLTADRAGWASDTDCDSLIWSGLACAGGAPVAISKAEYAPGYIHRRPAPSCFTGVDAGSKSTVSNDQMLGYLWCAWSNKDAGAFERLADYGEDRDWVMGEPVTEPGDVVLKPNQIGMTGRALYVLSNGSDDRYYRRLFRYYHPVEADYERHLQAIGIALQGEITAALEAGSLDATVHPQSDDGPAQASLALLDINGEMMKRLEDLTKSEPENALFHVALGTYTGDMTRGVELLLGDPPRPTYVRSKGGLADDAFARAEWLFAARLALKRMGN